MSTYVINEEDLDKVLEERNHVLDNFLTSGSPSSFLPCELKFDANSGKYHLRVDDVNLELLLKLSAQGKLNKI